jgi:hypothetical protein
MKANTKPQNSMSKDTKAKWEDTKKSIIAVRLAQSLPTMETGVRPENSRIENPFKKQIFGDLFGTQNVDNDRSLNGILYRARIQEAIHKKKQHKIAGDESAGIETNSFGNSVTTIDVLDSGSDSDYGGSFRRDLCSDLWWRAIIFTRSTRWNFSSHCYVLNSSKGIVRD